MEDLLIRLGQGEERPRMVIWRVYETKTSRDPEQTSRLIVSNKRISEREKERELEGE